MLENHRQHILWRAIPFAGVIAGTVFLLFNLILSPLVYGLDATVIIRYFASLVMGSSALVAGDNSILIVGILTHYVLSIAFTFVISLVVHHWGLMVGIVGGAIIGLSIYGINLYVGTLIFEWFFAINSLLFAVSHILFGAVAGGVYEMLDTYDQPLGGKQHETA